MLRRVNLFSVLRESAFASLISWIEINYETSCSNDVDVAAFLDMFVDYSG